MKIVPEEATKYQEKVLLPARQRVRGLFNLSYDDQPPIIAIVGDDEPRLVADRELRSFAHRWCNHVIVVGMGWLIKNEPALAESVAFGEPS